MNNLSDSDKSDSDDDSVIQIDAIDDDDDLSRMLRNLNFKKTDLQPPTNDPFKTPARTSGTFSP